MHIVPKRIGYSVAGIKLANFKQQGFSDSPITRQNLFRFGERGMNSFVFQLVETTAERKSLAVLAQSGDKVIVFEFGLGLDKRGFALLNALAQLQMLQVKNREARIVSETGIGLAEEFSGPVAVANQLGSTDLGNQRVAAK